MENTVTIIKSCPICFRGGDITINRNDYWEWLNGKPIEKVFLNLDPAQLAFLKMGICSSCFNDINLNKKNQKKS